MNDIIKKIKYSRLKEEDKCIIHILSLVKEHKSDKFEEYIFFINDKRQVFFEYNKLNGILWVDYSLVWNKFNDNFNMNDKEIELLIKKYFPYIKSDIWLNYIDKWRLGNIYL